MYLCLKHKIYTAYYLKKKNLCLDMLRNIEMNFRLEDSTCQKIPPKFEEIIKGIITKTQPPELTQKDIFLALIIYMFVENGFVPIVQDTIKSDSVDVLDVKQLSTLTLNTGACEITFILTGFNDIPVKLLMCPLASTVLVNVFISDVNSEVYSICLPINTFVASPEAATIPMIFRDLRQLTYIFKNKIVAPVKSSILCYCGYSSASLFGLPEEVLLNILLTLPINDIINVAKTCKRLSVLLENSRLWHKLFLRDFTEVVSDSNDWKKLYKDTYIAQKEERRRSCRLTGTLHDLMDFSDFVSYIDNPLWDVII
ncbi:uncharacterized protein LOC124533498 [Vanessa cardui]|uniref:uncharacterized protein LOC124533498 n=1 Tax=Vanessa cardui TaxID=171605 RepID=UPI001F13E9BE|nr:uncharacterized protein LOC124533498 [Vanessa cardui]